MAKKEAGPHFESNKSDIRYSFFPTARRKVSFYKPPILQCNEKADRRLMVFHVKLYLTGQPLVGLPEFIKDAYMSLETETSTVSKSILDGVKLDGMDLAFFSEESSQKFFCRLVNKNYYDFIVEREISEDTASTVLKFKFRTPENRGAFGLWSSHAKTDIWLESTPNSDAVRDTDERQMALGEEPDETEDSEDS